MPEPVLYMRGHPVLREPAITEEMVGDLKAITMVSADHLDAVAADLSSVDGFLDTTALNARLRALLPQDAPVASVRRVVLNLKSEDVERLLKQFRSIQEDNAEDFPLSAGDLDNLNTLLPRLLKPIPALRRYRKAERLAKITGQPLEDVQLICDLRPVFDESRKNIEGLIPFTHFKIVATGGDGLPRVFETELTAEQVSDLAEQAKRAVAKLEVLREKADQWADFGMPNVPLTRMKETGPSDE
jgi:hypothetical protein